MSSSPANLPVEPAPLARPKDRVISGSGIVIAMFLLGLTLTALLFIYFEFNTRPFKPLREAIGREFRHSRPNVEGGKLKGRGANTLRISMSVPFDPNRDAAKSNDVLARVVALARQHHDLNSFQVMDVNLIHFAPEQEAIIKSFSWPAADAAKESFTPQRFEPVAQ